MNPIVQTIILSASAVRMLPLGDGKSGRPTIGDDVKNCKTER